MHLCMVRRPAMIIPKSLPDELLVGYRGRLALVNGLQSILSLNAKLLAATVRPAGDIDPTCALVRVGAKAKGLSPMAFLEAHSNFRLNCPPRRVITAADLESSLGGNQVAHVISTSTRGLRGCTDCIDEDLSVHGFSYWRRSHHVPGRYHCPRHGKVLRLMRCDEEIPPPPDVLISTGLPASEDLLRAARQNPFIDRYLEHLDRVVDGRLSLDRSDPTGDMRRFLVEQGEPLHTRGWASRFAARTVHAFTLGWLQDVLSASCTSVEELTTRFVQPVLYDYMKVAHTTFAVLASVAAESSRAGDLAGTGRLNLEALGIERRPRRLRLTSEARYPPPARCLGAGQQ